MPPNSDKKSNSEARDIPKSPGDKRYGKKPRFSRPIRWGLLLVIVALTSIHVYYNFRRNIIIRAFPYITAELQQYVSDEMGAELEWDTARVDYLGRLVFRGLKFTLEGVDDPVAEAGLLVVELDEQGLISSRGGPVSVVEVIVIKDLQVRISHDEEGQWNLSSLLKPREEPFDPEKFPLRARVKFKDCSVEYYEPFLDTPDSDPLYINNLRGGVDLTDLSDIRVGLLWDIAGISTRTMSLKGRVDMLESSFNLSLAGGLDASPVADKFHGLTHGLEATGDVDLGISVSGTYTPDTVSPEPQGIITLSGCGFSHPALDETFTDINGSIQIDLTADFSNPAFKAYADGMTFKLGDNASGNATFCVGWLGEFAYTVDADIAGLSMNSLRTWIPKEIRDVYDLGGTVDVDLILFGDADGPSIDARFIPSPYIFALGIPFNSGEGHIVYSDSRLHLEDITLGSKSGTTIEFNGLLDFRDEPEYTIKGHATDVPVAVTEGFYPPAADWELEGYAGGTFSYLPVGNSHELRMRLAGEDVQTKWGEIDAVNAAFSISPDSFALDGLMAEAYGGNITAQSSADGKLQFSFSGLDKGKISDALGVTIDMEAGEIHGEGVVAFEEGTPELEAKFAISNPSWRDVHFQSLTGGIRFDAEGLHLDDVRAIGANGEIVVIEGIIPFDDGSELEFNAEVKNFDMGRLIPGRDGPPLSNTDITLKLTGHLDDIALDATLVENGLNIFGNKAYTCKAGSVDVGGNPGDSASPTPGEITIKGRLSLAPGDAEPGDGFFIGDLELSDVEISGMLHVGPYPSGLPLPTEYRHLLGKSPKSDLRPKNGKGLPLEGSISIDGHIDGHPGNLVGVIGLTAPEMKLGLQEIRGFSMGLKAAGPASFAVEGQWFYPSGGSVALEGPAGWDPEKRTSVVDLFLDIENAPMDEVLALAGIDISAYAEGLFDGGGRISGPVNNLALTDFKISASEGSILFGIQLEEGVVEFGLADGFLDLSKFEIVSRERTDGGRTRLSGNGEIYLEESGLLPQAQITASLVDYRLESLQALFDLSFPLGGRVDAEINYTEVGNKWNLEYELQLGELEYRGHSLPAVNAIFSFDPLGGRFNIAHVEIDDGQGGWIRLNGSTTIGLLTAIFDPTMRSDLRYQRVDLNLTAEDFDLGTLAGFLPDEVEFGGKLKGMNLHIKGKPTAPDINGTIAPDIGPVIYSGLLIADAIGTYSDEGLSWEDGLLLMAGDLFIKRGDSVAVLEGDIDFRPLNPLTVYDPRYVAPSENRVALKMNTPEPMRLEGEGYWFDVVPEGMIIGITDASGESGNGTASGGGLEVEGKLIVSAGFLDALRIKIPQGAGGAKAAINYDITIALGSGCRLKAGSTLDATLQSGELNLYGTSQSPQLQGRVEIAHGKLNFLARIFNLLPGAEVTFNPIFGVNPFLKAEAEAVLTQHPKAETGAEPLIISAVIEAFLSDIGRGIKLSSNYPYSTDELLAILGYQHFFLALEEEGLGSALTSGIYIYPSGLISRYVEEMAGFHRFELTFNLENNVVIDLEKELFNKVFLTYGQTFGEGSNYTWGSKYRFQPRSYVGFRYENLDFQDKQDWVYFIEYLMPLK